MSLSPKIAVIYYSSSGTIHAMAEALAEGAREAGAQVQVRRAAELAPRAAIESNPGWKAYVDEVAPNVPEATLDDLRWADGYAFGTPTRFGTPAPQLLQFISTTGGLWQEGVFADKPVTSFTSAINTHGGQESTILALSNVFYHWGSLIVPPGFTDDAVYAGGGNPYGTSHGTGMPPAAPTDGVLTAVRYQGRRLAGVTSRLQAGSSAG